MIAATMLGATLVGLLLAVAAALATRMFRIAGRPARWLWVSGSAGTALWTGAALLQLSPVLARLAPVPDDILPQGLARLNAYVVQASAEPHALTLDALLLVGWVTVSAFLIGRILSSLHRLERVRRASRMAQVDGVPVRIASEDGPAVLGFRKMDVLLPEWALALDAPLRAMVLRHELEHVRARDPWLLVGSAALVAVMPWNPALWWHARQLRLAIELDCDGRVLRSHPRPERYGLLLLAMAQRRSAGPAMLAPALSEPLSQLERRIIAMRRLPSRTSRAHLAASTLTAVAAVVLACSVDAPQRSTAPKQSSRMVAGPRSQAQPYVDFQVEKQAAVMPNQPAPRYPDMLRTARVQGEVLSQFVVDTTGRAEMNTFRVLKSSHDLFTNAVKNVLPQMRFHAAEVGGRKVRQLVQMPWVFSLSR